ncbi:hypothetical protein JO972_11040 [Verrucomicrobiaceae bacterium 5K15]|uniref:DUF4138 domain-containing protein n=1 Tax=Oceaniferula flava TaxID=2800421 RepID=A0AAE2VCC1_9BACT|nr:hypothetical protein [Oceaniferula flavus]MBK1855495.1 hypothetical protein [Oceaniferula flavus]MBM1136801.1 hypothetical protein [Oceaniferula flavus]
MKILLPALSILALVASSLHAQTADQQTVKVSLYAFEHAKDHHTVYLASPNKDLYEIALSTANILGPFQTVRDEDGAVTLRTQTTNKEGVTVYPELAKVKIKPGIKEPLLILIPVPGGQTYRTFVMDRSLRSFPKGTYKLINFSPHKVRGLIGESRIHAAPRKTISITPSLNEEGLLDVHFQYAHGERWKTFGRTRWVRRQEKRSLLCTYIDPKRKRMKIRAVSLQTIRPRSERFNQASR